MKRTRGHQAEQGPGSYSSEGHTLLMLEHGLWSQCGLRFSDKGECTSWLRELEIDGVGCCRML